MCHMMEWMDYKACLLLIKPVHTLVIQQMNMAENVSNDGMDEV